LNGSLEAAVSSSLSSLLLMLSEIGLISLSNSSYVYVAQKETLSGEKPEPEGTHLHNMIIVVASLVFTMGRPSISLIKAEMISHYLAEFSIPQVC